MTQPIIAILLSPVLLAQAFWVRWRTPRLPEPPGPRSGKAGRGRLLRLLIMGDSAAAGVGAHHQNESLSGQLVERLAVHFEVQWRLEAESGATTASAMERLDRLERQPFDVVLTSLGVNDVTGRVRRRDWLVRQRELREKLTGRFSSSLVIVSGLPPMHGFPALPQPLRAFLGARATLFDRELATDIGDSPGCRFLSLRFTEDLSMIAEDGFHPGPGVYAEWARRAAEITIDCFGANTE